MLPEPRNDRTRLFAEALACILYRVFVWNAVPHLPLIHAERAPALPAFRPRRSSVSAGIIRLLEVRRRACDDV